MIPVWWKWEKSDKELERSSILQFNSFHWSLSEFKRRNPRFFHAPPHSKIKQHPLKKKHLPFPTWKTDLVHQTAPSCVEYYCKIETKIHFKDFCHVTIFKTRCFWSAEKSPVLVNLKALFSHYQSNLRDCQTTQIVILEVPPVLWFSFRGCDTRQQFFSSWFQYNCKASVALRLVGDAPRHHCSLF